jgi:large subunit ribosomal protein L17
MHRHGYQGKKLQMAAGPRRALIRGQVTSLVLHEQITTTEAKAKAIAPYFERMVTKAKKADLHNRRQLASFLLTEKAVEKLISEIAPAFKDRRGGYTRVVKLGNRQGDNAKMAAVMLTAEPVRGGSPEAKSSAAKTEKSATATSAKAAVLKKPASKTESKKTGAK